MKEKLGHEGRVLFGDEARQLIYERQWTSLWPEGVPASCVAWCKCGWWEPALHGEQAEQLLSEHLNA